MRDLAGTTAASPTWPWVSTRAGGQALCDQQRFLFGNLLWLII